MDRTLKKSEDPLSEYQKDDCRYEPSVHYFSLKPHTLKWDDLPFERWKKAIWYLNHKHWSWTHKPNASQGMNGKLRVYKENLLYLILHKCAEI